MLRSNNYRLYLSSPPPPLTTTSQLGLPCLHIGSVLFISFVKVKVVRKNVVTTLRKNVVTTLVTCTFVKSGVGLLNLDNGSVKNEKSAK